MNKQDLLRHARPAARLLKAMSNEHRLMILCQLATGEATVGQLAARLGLSPSALSQHLAKLRADGLVMTRRHAQTITYALSSPEAEELIITLIGLYCVPDDVPTAPHAEETESR